MSIQKGNDQHDLNEIAYATRAMTDKAPTLPDEPKRYCGRAMVETFSAETGKSSGEYISSADYDALLAYATSERERAEKAEASLNECSCAAGVDPCCCPCLKTWKDAAEQAEARAEAMAKALQRIVDGIPACGSDGIYIEHFDGEGNSIGTEYVDPLSVIQSIQGIAIEAIEQGAQRG